MTIRATPLAILFAVCLAQALFLAPVIANLKSANPRATRILAALLFCFLPMVGEEWIGAAGLTVQFPNSIASSMTVDFLLAPLLLFYARALTEPSRGFARRDVLHFIPFLLASLVLLPFYRLSANEKLLLLDNQAPVSFTIVVTGKIVMAAVYITVIIRRLRSFLRSTSPARARDPHIVWFLRAMVALACVAGLMIVLGVLPQLGESVPIDSDSVGAVFICASVFLFSFPLIRYPLSALAAEPIRLLVPQPIRPKYETSPLSEPAKQEYHARLVRYMEAERPYLDMRLSLEKLASALEIRPAWLSQVLNERLHLNFYEFVNEYRVREAQARLGEPKQSAKTLLAIAYESGFNSKASFNRAFKRVTGQTPSGYARAGVIPQIDSTDTSQLIQ